MRHRVLIRGDGIAASCCARLLCANDLEVSVSTIVRPKIPFVLISGSTQLLLCDVFSDAELFQGLHPVRTRIVLWGKQSNPTVFRHFAVVATEDLLLERLWFSVSAGVELTNEDVAWQVITSPPVPPDSAPCQFGTRMAFTTDVGLQPGAESEACWIESLEDGWLFLVNLGNQRGSLVSVGGTPESLMRCSRLVGPQVREIGPTVGQFPAYPQILSKLCGSGWLACGTGAMTFDPLCGDGTGNAVREAILGSAAIQGIFRGFNANDVLGHYSLRLRAGFLRHLELCLEFYKEARSGPWWNLEIAHLEQGIAWTRNQIRRGGGPPRYRLVDFQLEEITLS